MSENELVTVKVVHGSVCAVWLKEKYEKGDTFEATRKQVASLDPRFVMIVEDEPVVEVAVADAPELVEEAVEPDVVEVPVEVEDSTVMVEEVSEEPVEEKPKKKKKK